MAVIFIDVLVKMFMIHVSWNLMRSVHMCTTTIDDVTALGLNLAVA